MKKSMIRNLWGLVVLLSLSMCFTSCEGALDDILGEWSRPVPEDSDPGPVTSVTFNESSQVLYVGDYFPMIPTVTPQDADYTLTWSSSDETVATVNETGIIHAEAAGTATITVEAGGLKATLDVLVEDPYSKMDYKEASCDGTKVTFTKKTKDAVGVIDNGFSGTIASGWYSVIGYDVIIDNDVTLTGDTYLILCDDAQLTINKKLDCGTHKLYIYGQAKSAGKLIVKDGISNGDLEIHGGEIKATTTTKAICISYNTTFEVYGGEVLAENAPSGEGRHGIQSTSTGTFTVYGGKVKSIVSGMVTNSHAIYTKIKSGTPNIKFYFASTEAGLDTAEGNTYDGTSVAPGNCFAKAE